MKVKILYFANFKDVSGKDSEYLELNENSIAGLTSMILSKYKPLENLIWDTRFKALKKNISLVINDKLIQDREKEHLVLKDGDKVAFLLPFSGG